MGYTGSFFGVHKVGMPYFVGIYTTVFKQRFVGFSYQPISFEFALYCV